MMCIISKERIAFCAQVEGTRGVVFAVSPITLQSRCKRVPNETISTYGQSWPSPPECSFKIGDQQSEKKRWSSDRRAICNATRGIKAAHGVIRHRGVSDGSDGARLLWQSHSAQTELFFADACDIKQHPHFSPKIPPTLRYLLHPTYLIPASILRLQFTTSQNWLCWSIYEWILFPDIASILHCECVHGKVE
jgi:hypothetical protein